MGRGGRTVSCSREGEERLFFPGPTEGEEGSGEGKKKGRERDGFFKIRQKDKDVAAGEETPKMNRITVPMRPYICNGCHMLIQARVGGGTGASACMGADASMVAVLIATNPNHRPPQEQRARNPSHLLDAWMHV